MPLFTNPNGYRTAGQTDNERLWETWGFVSALVNHERVQQQFFQQPFPPASPFKFKMTPILASQIVSQFTADEMSADFLDARMIDRPQQAARVLEGLRMADLESELLEALDALHHSSLAVTRQYVQASEGVIA